MRVTKKQCSASAKQCEELLAAYNALKEKHATTKMELSKLEENILQIQNEITTANQEFLASLQVYNEMLDRQNRKKRLLDMKNNIRRKEETLYRLKEEIKVLKMKTEKFKAENDCREEHSLRMQFIALRNDYDAYEKFYLFISKQYMVLKNQSLECAAVDFIARWESRELMKKRLMILNEERNAFSDKEFSLKLEALNALEEYNRAKQERETLVEFYNKSSKRNSASAFDKNLQNKKKRSLRTRSKITKQKEATATHSFKNYKTKRSDRYALDQKLRNKKPPQRTRLKITKRKETTATHSSKNNETKGRSSRYALVQKLRNKKRPQCIRPKITKRKETTATHSSKNNETKK